MKTDSPKKIFGALKKIGERFWRGEKMAFEEARALSITRVILRLEFYHVFVVQNLKIQPEFIRVLPTGIYIYIRVSPISTTGRGCRCSPKPWLYHFLCWLSV